MNVFGLIGHPLSYSFSKQYFENKFLKESISNAQFNLFDLEKIEDFEKLLLNTAIKGLAVTIPYKKNVIHYLHHLSEVVNKIQACNCIKFVDQKLYGFNTDVIGFEKSFIKTLKPCQQKALILGNGGAAAAIKYVLDKLNIQYSLVSRTKKNDCLTYEDLNEEIILSHQIIINTTPLGTFPNVDTCPNLLYHFITDKHYLFDVVYNPECSLFLQKGLEQKAFVKNGYEMLCIQAEENWKIWNE